MGKKLDVLITTLDRNYELTIESNITGKQLFDQIASTIALKEIKFFGLHFKDKHGFEKWVKLNKKLMSQDVKKQYPLEFSFRVKFFPEDVEEQLSHDSVALRLLYLQVQHSITNGEMHCPPETMELLESYAHKDSWLHYLEAAQHLDMYGNNYFEVKDRTGIDLWFSVHSLGLNIYEKADNLKPKIVLQWSDIRNLSFNGKKFIIKFGDTKTKDMILICAHFKMNKVILGLSMGYHELYLRRRLEKPM